MSRLLSLVVVLGWAILGHAKPPNMVLILTDDLGNHDLGVDGRTDHSTPNLDRLAKQGIRYVNSYSAAPLCSATRAALMSGKSPARLNITSYLPGRADAASQAVLQPKMASQLPLEEITIAEALKTVGYTTACIGKWHLGGAMFGPKQQGFDVVFAGTPQSTPSDTEAGKGEYGLTTKAIDFIKDHRDKPFFLYLAHNNPHIPLGAKPDLVKKHEAAFHPTYAAMLESLDDSIGRLLKTLDEQKLTEDTIVIFTSDNGGLHVPELKDDAPTYNQLRAGKGFIYDGGIRVPLIIRYPGVIKPGSTSTALTISTDLPHTLADITGAKLNGTKDGQSLRPTWSGETWATRSLYWHFPHYSNQGGRPASAIRQGDLKLIEFLDQPEIELYNLADNPPETASKNLAKAMPDRTKELRDTLNRWRNDVGAKTVTPNPAFDATAFKRLYRETDVTQPLSGKTAREVSAKLRDWRLAIDAAGNSAGKGK